MHSTSCSRSRTAAGDCNNGDKLTTCCSLLAESGSDLAQMLKHQDDLVAPSSSQQQEGIFATKSKHWWEMYCTSAI